MGDTILLYGVEFRPSSRPHPLLVTEGVAQAGRAG